MEWRVNNGFHFNLAKARLKVSVRHFFLFYKVLTPEWQIRHVLPKSQFQNKNGLSKKILWASWLWVGMSWKNDEKMNSGSKRHSIKVHVCHHFMLFINFLMFKHRVSPFLCAFIKKIWYYETIDPNGKLLEYIYKAVAVNPSSVVSNALCQFARSIFPRYSLVKTTWSCWPI